MRHLFVIAAVFAVAALGCSTGDSLPEDDVIWVAFDGQECLVTGSASYPAGTVMTVVLTNDSEVEAEVAVARVYPHGVTGQERTFDDFVELQRAGGGVLWEDPADPASPLNWLRIEALSFDREQLALESTLTDHQRTKEYQLANMMGEAVVFVSTKGEFDPDHGTTPHGYWFCAPLEVTALEF